MTYRRVLFISISFGIPWWLSGVARAVDPKQPSKAPTPATSPALSPIQLDSTAEASSATIETMIELAVRNITIRYNLNEAQVQATSEIMKRDVWKFLREHEAEIWPVIRSLLASQLGTRRPEDLEEVKRLGAAALPLLKPIEEAIYRGNDDWREILTPDQKKMHDFDMAEMRRQFQVIHGRCQTWADGRPIEGGLFPPQDLSKSPPRPARPREGLPVPVIEETFNPTVFESFVEQFIREYKLDQAQVDAAKSILRETLDKVADFRSTNKESLGRLASTIREAMQRRDHENRRIAEGEYKQLVRPVYDLFSQMENRLKALLNSVQLAQYDANRGTSGSAPPTATGEAANPSEVGTPGAGADEAVKPTEPRRTASSSTVTEGSEQGKQKAGAQEQPGTDHEKQSNR